MEENNGWKKEREGEIKRGKKEIENRRGQGEGGKEGRKDEQLKRGKLIWNKARREN